MILVKKKKKIMFVKINKRYINKINYFNRKKFKINIFSHLITI